MRISRTPIRTAAALAVAVLMGVMPIPANAGAASAQTHIVHIGKFKFDPGELIVAPGDTVIWINDDPVPHTVSSEDASWESDRLDASDQWELVVLEGMSESYICRYHPTMTARLQLRPRTAE